MKRAGSWGIVRSSVTWLALILLGSGSAIANPPNPAAASGNDPTAQSAPSKIEIEAPPPVSGPTHQSLPPESEVETPPLEPAPAVENPTPSPETDAPPPVSDSTDQSASPKSEVEALPSASDTVDQSAPSAPEAEDTILASDPVVKSIAQDPVVEEPASAVDSTVQGKKSNFKVVLENAEIDITLTTGIRKDDLQWSIAGNSAGTSPNILSELTWSDVDSYQFGLINRTTIKRLLYLRGELNYAFVQNGRIQDSDYRDDNRGDEYSRSISNCSGDQVWDISLAAGYPFYFFQDRMTVAPLLGYAYHSQNFRITDGEQVVTDPSPNVPDLGPLPGLNSTYRSTWQGPWIGCDLHYRLPDQGADKSMPMELGLSVGLHFADYEAEANWNLRADLEHPISFAHKAEGYGIALAGEWLVGLADNWEFVFRASYQYWKTDHGDNYAYKTLGPDEHTRLNEVVWSNYSFLVGANFHF